MYTDVTLPHLYFTLVSCINQGVNLKYYVCQNILKIYCFILSDTIIGFKVYSASSALFMPSIINKYNMNMAYKQTTNNNTV